MFWIALVCLVVGVSMAICFRQVFDYPVMRFVNNLLGGVPLAEKLLLAPSRFEMLGGPVFAAGIWLVWFAESDEGSRARVIAGLVGASAGGAISRFLQVLLPTHPRPIHDAALAFVPPSWIDPDTLNHWNSFPSDHAALFFGLAAVMFLVTPRLGLAAFAWALLVSLGRVFGGLHFVSDIIGGAGLGLILVCLFQHPTARARCAIVSRWAAHRPAAFYACAFLVTYEIASLFEGVRDVGHAVTHLLQS